MYIWVTSFTFRFATGPLAKQCCCHKGRHLYHNNKNNNQMDSLQGKTERSLGSQHIFFNSVSMRISQHKYIYLYNHKRKQTNTNHVRIRRILSLHQPPCNLQLDLCNCRSPRMGMMVPARMPIRSQRWPK